MRFNRKSKRFGSRFGQSYGRSSGSGSKNISAKAKQFQALISKHYGNYVESLQLETRHPKERIVLILLSLFTAGMTFGLLSTTAISVFLPSARNIESLMKVESTVFYDRNGKTLYTLHDEENREVIKSEDIPKFVKQAAVSIEDNGFYEHNGIDIPAIGKAVLSELGIGPRRGGSTITQQFVKNTVLSSERTYLRKFKEIILATRIEKYHTKDEILTMYLNKIPYGGTSYGVEKAAEVFFNKDAKDLNLAEAVILAALPQAPSYYSPFGENKYSSLSRELTLSEIKSRKIKDISDLERDEYNIGLIGKSYLLADGTNLYLPGRTDEVLKQMENQKYISEEVQKKSLTEVQNYVFNEYVATIKAPHFVFYVRDLLEKKYDKELVSNGGLKVYTTLDFDLYEEARKAIETQTASNLKRFNANNMASLSINPATGEILSMVGSADFTKVEIEGYNNITINKKQPGSSFKPIVYATAFLNGYGPGTVLYDVPTKLDDKTPKNYDGSFRGPMSIRSALGQSRNIPAIKAYFLAGEQEGVINQAEKMGITSLNRNVDYGWPLALGAGEVTMMEMVEAFSVFANGGEKVPTTAVLKVLDSKGKILEDNTKTVPTKTRVLDEQVAFLINNILSDRSVNLGGALNLPDGRVSAIKTGTSTKVVGDTILPSNLWSIGYTPQIVTAVWAGNTNGKELGLSGDGYNGAVPVWNKIMSFALKDAPKVNFARPEEIKSVSISKLSGKLAGENTPANLVTTDVFASFAVPKEVDNSFYKASVDSRNNKRPNAFCPPDFVKELTFYNPQAEIQGRFNWQAEIISWFNGLTPEKVKELNLGENVVVGSPVEEDSELCTPELANKALEISFANLAEGDVVPKGPFTLEASVEAEAGVEKVEFFLNDVPATVATSAPYTADMRVPIGFKVGREFMLKAKVTDKNGFTKEQFIKVKTGEADASLEPALSSEE